MFAHPTIQYLHGYLLAHVPPHHIVIAVQNYAPIYSTYTLCHSKIFLQANHPHKTKFNFLNFCITKNIPSFLTLKGKFTLPQKAIKNILSNIKKATSKNIAIHYKIYIHIASQKIKDLKKISHFLLTTHPP